MEEYNIAPQFTKGSTVLGRDKGKLISIYVIPKKIVKNYFGLPELIDEGLLENSETIKFSEPNFSSYTFNTDREDLGIYTTINLSYGLEVDNEANKLISGSEYIVVMKYVKDIVVLAEDNMLTKEFIEYFGSAKIDNPFHRISIEVFSKSYIYSNINRVISKQLKKLS